MKSPYFSSSSSSSSLSLTLFCLFFIMPGFPVSQSDPELYNEYEQGYERCHDALFECGDMQAGYPFFGGDRVKECGHRELKLLCDHRTNTTIGILGVNYRVLGIQHDRLILTISKSKESVMNSVLCPLRYPDPDSDSILDFQVLTPGPNFTNVTLFFDCPWSPANISSGLRVFPCLHDDYGGKGVTVAIASNTHPEGCSANLTVSILQTSWEGVRNLSLELEQAFQKGFEVRWKEDKEACSNCNASRGACGFDKEDQTVCYCPSGSWPEPDHPKFSKCYHPPPPPPSSPAGGNNSKARKIELAIGIAGAASMLVGIGILLVWQQRRRKIAAQVISGELPTSSSSKGLTNSSYYTSKCDEIERGSSYFGAHVFNYEELEEATDNFNPSKQLGAGGFGTVYYGVLKDGRVVAVKRLYENNVKRVDQYMNEIEILTLIRHPNLVTLYGCTSRRSRELLLVYEYIPNGTLADHLHGKRSNSGSLTWNVRLSIAMETAMALAYLHASDIIHRDVKSNNILLDNNFHVKVADFGLSRLFPADVTHVSTAPQGTPGYVDPEYHQCYHLTEKSDVYSFGVVLMELISAKKAVDTNRNRHDINLANMAINRIENQELPELVDPSLRFEHDYVVKNAVTAVAGLAFQCLQQERNMRPSMREVLQTLREIEEVRKEAEVLDIGSNDVKRLFKNTPPPPSPDYGTEKRVQRRSI